MSKNKVCILGDLHFGMRNDSTVFLDYGEKFYSQCLFPYLKKHNIKTIIQLGDFFDRRKYINYLTYERTLEIFIRKLDYYGIKLTLIPGNHDVFYKNTNEINSLELLLDGSPNVQILYTPQTIFFGKVAMIPWITEDNYESTMEFLKDTRANICMGHFDIAGFSMYKGMPSEDGMDGSNFNKFDLTLSGHFHHRSRQGKIMYVGTPMQITWQDYDDPKGFHILDLHTLEMEFIQNPFEIFHQIKYDDKEDGFALASKDLSMYTSTYVKVIVLNKSNPHLFERFITRLYEVNPVDVTIIEDFTNLGDDTIAENSLDQADDTLTIINKYIDASGYENLDTDKLKNLMHELYVEALNETDI